MFIHSFGLNNNIVDQKLFEEWRKNTDMRSLMWIDFNPLQNRDMIHIAYPALSSVPTCDKLVLVCHWEAPDMARYWYPIFALAHSMGYRDVLVIDGGTGCGIFYDHPRGGKLHHIFSPFLVANEPDSPLEIVPSHDRSIKFIALARVVKQHRVRATVRMLEAGLDEHGIITCGWHQPEDLEIYKNIIPDELWHRFPMRYGSEVPIAAEDRCTWTMHPAFSKAIFNVVLETNFEHCGDNLFEHWQRRFVTEKSMKPYRLMQFPLFIATAGHVQLQRDMGFDVFDDLIDHSYDWIGNPFNRITAVVKQLKDFVAKHTLSDLQQIHQKHWHRFEQNKRHAETLGPKLKEKYEQEITHWVTR